MPTRVPIRQILLVATASLALALAASAPATLAAPSNLLVVASGLDNPRGLAFRSNGYLYVVEAGRGGNSSLCLPSPEPPIVNHCYGPSGAITEVSALNVHRRVVTGLPSLAPASGEGATGPHDIEFGFGSAWVTVGLGHNPADRAQFAANGIELGSLIQVMPTGAWQYVVDISAHEAASNPDGGAVDSNPYGLRVLSDRGLVTDAGANALLQIALDGSISTLAVFPDRTVPAPGGGTMPMQSVPTSVAVAPDGSLYVGELTGFPFVPGAARVYHVPAGGGTPAVVADGFTNIIDIAISRTGVGYVLEHDADSLFAPVGPGSGGRITRVEPDGTRTVIASDGLVRPGGLTIGPDGALYVTNYSTSAGLGEVVRIPQ